MDQKIEMNNNKEMIQDLANNIFYKKNSQKSIEILTKRNCPERTKVPQPGFEPGTTRSSVWRSPRLSY